VKGARNGNGQKGHDKHEKSMHNQDLDHPLIHSFLGLLCHTMWGNVYIFYRETLYKGDPLLASLPYVQRNSNSSYHKEKLQTKENDVSNNVKRLSMWGKRWR
jgi:hypothetical protein